MKETGAPSGAGLGQAATGSPSGHRKLTDPVSIRAVVIEDSPTQRTQLVRILQADGDIEVVGLATTAGEAVELVDRIQPDVVALGHQNRARAGRTAPQRPQNFGWTVGGGQPSSGPSSSSSPPSRMCGIQSSAFGIHQFR